MRSGLGSAAWFAVLTWLIAIILLPYSSASPVNVLEPFATLVAHLTQSALGWVGVGALRAGTFLYVPGVFEYEIRAGCTGILPAAVLTVAIVASPGNDVAKRWGLIVGVPLVLAVNLLRLLHLFYLGVHAPQHFALAHSVLWEGTIVLCTFAVWLAWARYAPSFSGFPRRSDPPPGRGKQLCGVRLGGQRLLSASPLRNTMSG
jgi:exosortase/archaeosortase family protein